MNQPLTHSTAEPKTIRELLLQLVNSRNASGTLTYKLGEGAHADGYSFPTTVPGLEDYVIRFDRNRIHIAQLKTALEGTTSLTPVDHLLVGANTGQAFMQLSNNDGLTIHLKQTGISLEGIMNAHVKKHRVNNASTDAVRADAKLHIMEMILDLANENRHTNPLLPLFEISSDLGSLGYEPDFAINNLIFNKTCGSIGLIDQLNNSSQSEHFPHITDPAPYRMARLQMEAVYLQTQLDVEDFPEGYDSAHFKKIASQFDRLVKDALTKVEAERSDTSSITPVRFSKVTHVQAVSLDEPPHVLLERLREIQKQANIPER